MGKEMSLPGMEEFEKKKVTKKNKKKTQMVVGNQSYVNSVTGEMEEFMVIQKNVSKDFNFHKIWLEDLLNILNSMGNKKVTILSHLLGIMKPSDNSVAFTMRSLSEDTKVSLPTCQSTINELLESNVIKRDRTVKQIYYFNPDLLVKGDSNKRRKLLIEYNYEDTQKDNQNKQKLLDNLKVPEEEIIETEIEYKEIKK